MSVISSWSWLAILDLKLTDKLINYKVNLRLFIITVICITMGYLVNPIVIMIDNFFSNISELILA